MRFYTMVFFYALMHITHMYNITFLKQVGYTSLTCLGCIVEDKWDCKWWWVWRAKWGCIVEGKWDCKWWWWVWRAKGVAFAHCHCKLVIEKLKCIGLKPLGGGIPRLRDLGWGSIGFVKNSKKFAKCIQRAQNVFANASPRKGWDIKPTP